MKKILFYILALVALGFSIDPVALPHTLDTAATPRVSYIDDNDGAIKTSVDETIDSVNAHTTFLQGITDDISSDTVKTNYIQQKTGTSITIAPTTLNVNSNLSVSNTGSNIVAITPGVETYIDTINAQLGSINAKQTLEVHETDYKLKLWESGSTYPAIGVNGTDVIEFSDGTNAPDFFMDYDYPSTMNMTGKVNVTSDFDVDGVTTLDELTTSTTATIGNRLNVNYINARDLPALYLDDDAIITGDATVSGTISVDSITNETTNLDITLGAGQINVNSPLNVRQLFTVSNGAITYLDTMKSTSGIGGSYDGIVIDDNLQVLDTLKIDYIDDVSGGGIVVNSSTIMADVDFDLVANTADGSDDQYVGMSGGGGYGPSRGGSVRFFGNEEPTYPGSIRVDIGNVAGSEFVLRAVGVDRFKMNQNGTFDVNKTMTFNSGADLIVTDDLIIGTSSPASGDACTAGTITWDASYIYVCTASGAYKRAALTGGY